MWLVWLVLEKEQGPYQLRSLLKGSGNSCIRWV